MRILPNYTKNRVEKALVLSNGVETLLFLNKVWYITNTLKKGVK